MDWSDGPALIGWPRGDPELPTLRERLTRAWEIGKIVLVFGLVFLFLIVGFLRCLFWLIELVGWLI